jgi:diacylglycerol kinase family enzyme
MDSPRYAVILNPASGGLIGRDAAGLGSQIKAGFASLGIDARVEIATGIGIERAILRARDASPRFDAIVVGGGDGTVAHAAAALAGRDIPLGILPFGTLNLLARDLGIPSELDPAIAALAAAKPRAIDLGEANGIPFCCMATLGLVPMLGRVREKQRGRPPLLAWPQLVRAWVRALYWDPQVELALDLGDSVRSLRTRAMGISVGAFTPGYFLQRQALDQGVLVVYVVRHHSRWALLRFVLDLLTGQWHRDPELDIVPSSALRVQARRKRVALMLDGELIRIRTPLVFRVRPHALTVLVPHRADATVLTQ